MALLGAALLLPGLCAMIFGVGNLSSSSSGPLVAMLVFFGLLAAAVGVLLLRAAVRGPRP